MPNYSKIDFSILKKPLIYASKNNFKNIDKIKEISVVIEEIIVRLLIKNQPEEIEKLLKKIKKSFGTYETADLQSKKVIIKNSLNDLSKLEETLKKYYYENIDVYDNSSVLIEHPPLNSLESLNIIKTRFRNLLKKRGVHTIEDLLFYFPRKYEDRRNIKTISNLNQGEYETVIGDIVESTKVFLRKGKIYKVVISDETGRMNLIWFKFNEKYMKSTYEIGKKLIVSGEVSYNSYDRSLQIIHPSPENIEVIDYQLDELKENLHFGRIVPIYSLTEGLTQKRIRMIINEIIKDYPKYYEKLLPLSVRENQNLNKLDVSIRNCHFPDKKNSMVVDLDSSESVYNSPPHRTVSFFEFFLLELNMAVRKSENLKIEGPTFEIGNLVKNSFVKNLPFELTEAQTRVLKEIDFDLQNKYPMNRLLQGDVGSGKTIVALIAMLSAVDDGYQACIMAPTEILSEQHYETISDYLKNLDIEVCLLTSALSKKKKDKVYNKILNGEAKIVVGTHALIQEKVNFNNLGIVIIDEQHRFGVLQRAKLMEKGKSPNVLVMTATPIPRTLAITLYGDLEISILDQLPPNRKSVRTFVYKDNIKNLDNVYSFVRAELDKGRQAFFVYPFIEESENLDLKHIRHVTKMVDELKSNNFKNYNVGLLHGRMVSEEKDEIMQKFSDYKLDILVSTTVIEVGIDVPNATVIVVSNAERYGLSQLHQLRGRIGRGEHESYCILISSYKSSEEANKKLSIMAETNDGFKIAESDLELRGPGEFLGTKQSGLPQFNFANLVRDKEILFQARQEAIKLIEENPDISDYPELRYYIDKKYHELRPVRSIS